VVLEKKTTFPCITLARCSVGNTDALGHLYIQKKQKKQVTTQNVHSHPHGEVQKSKDYITPKSICKKYIVTDEKQAANYWVKKAVC